MLWRRMFGSFVDLMFLMTGRKRLGGPKKTDDKQG